MVNAVISVVVFYLAVRVHLPVAQIQRYMRDAEHESEEEEDLMGTGL